LGLHISKIPCRQKAILDEEKRNHKTCELQLEDSTKNDLKPNYFFRFGLTILIKAALTS
jgi:hypothetical protein